MDYTFSNHAQLMTQSLLSINGAKRDMTQNLLRVSLGLGLANQVLNVIEALPGVEDTLLNLCHVLTAHPWGESTGLEGDCGNPSPAIVSQEP